MTKRRTMAVSGALLVLSVFLAAAADRAREQKYQQAVDLLESKGDVKGAIKLFEEAVKTPDRNLAARSLLYLGSCYEKLGQDGAQKAYRRLLQDFSDQADVIAKARARLAALDKPTERGVVARRIWASMPSDNYTFADGVSRDGRYLAFIDYGNHTLNIKDTVTGEAREVLRRASPTDRYFRWVSVSPSGKKLAYCSSHRDEPNQLHIVGVDGSNPHPIGQGCPGEWSADEQYILAGPNLVRVSVLDGSTRTIASGDVFSTRYSPDGRYIAFVKAARGRRMQGPIFVVPANGGSEVLLVQGYNKDVFWAPDGKSLVFTSDRRGSKDLWSIRVDEGKPAGPPEMLREHIDSLLGISRTGDLFYEAPNAVSDIYTAALNPQTARLASQPMRITNRYINRAPAWSPDGESLVYYSQRGTMDWTQAGLSIIVRAMRTGEERTVPLQKPIFLGPYHPYWFPDGHSLFAQFFGGMLRIDLQTGEARQLLNSVKLARTNIGTQTASLGPDGRSVYYLARDENSDATRVMVRDLEDSGEKELFRAHHAGIPTLSPDRSRLALLSESERGGWVLFTIPASGGPPKELYRQQDSSLMPSSRYPVWSKDGKHLFIATAPPNGKSNGDIWSIPAEGGEPQPLGIAMNKLADLDLHPDGKQLVFTNSEWRDEIWVVKNVFADSRASR